MRLFESFAEELGKIGAGPIGRIVERLPSGKKKARTPRSRPVPGVTTTPFVPSQAASAGIGEDLVLSGGQPGSGGF